MKRTESFVYFKREIGTRNRRSRKANQMELAGFTHTLLPLPGGNEGRKRPLVEAMGERLERRLSG